MRFLMPQHRVNKHLWKGAAEPLLAPSAVFCRAVLGSLLVFPSQPRSRIKLALQGWAEAWKGPIPVHQPL